MTPVTATGPVRVHVMNVDGDIARTINAEASITIGRPVPRVPLALRPYLGKIGRKAARSLARRR